MRAPQRLLLVLLALSLSCSDDDGTGPDPGPVTEATATIQAKGGSVAVENESGISMTVTLPPGAVLTPTQVSLRAIDPPAGVRARFVIEPAGLDLLVPATFTVRLPDDVSMGATNGLTFTGSETVHVPAQVDPVERTLTASIHQLGFDFPSTTALAQTAAFGGDSGEFIDVDAMECQFIRESLDNQILRAQAFSGAFPPDLASPIIQEYRAALLVCESADSIAAASSILREIACTNSSSAQNNVLVITTAAELKQQLGFLLSAEALVQLTGADCHVADNKIEAAFLEFLDAYIARINDEDFVANFPNWDSIWKELIPCFEIRALADAFELPAVSDRINQEVFPALFAKLREVASAACTEDENNSFLLDMAMGGHNLNHPVTPVPEFPAHTGFTQSELVDEMLTCGSSVFVEAKTADNELLDSDTVALREANGGVRVIRGGRIVVTSDILAFTCNNLVVRGPIRVRAEVPGMLPVVQIGNLSGSLTVNVASVMSSLPEVEEEAPRNFDLVIERDRNLCGIDETGVIELVRIAVNTHGFSGAAAGTWTGGCPNGAVSGTFSISIDDDGVVTGAFDGSATGTISGNVLANGTFDASATGTAGSCAWTGAMSIDGGVLSGSGSWSCDQAGCSGSYSSNTSP
jgi:hypothetical protein